MNRIKEHAEKTKALLDEIATLRSEGVKHDAHGVPYDRTDGLTIQQARESQQCLSAAREYLQTGQMWFVRAVALPSSF